MVYCKTHYQNNKEKIHARNNRWRKENPEKIKFFGFKTKLKINYGLSYSEYLRILKSQDNLCAICGNGGKLVVDHCHSFKNVRGLLCNNCNFGLGHFKDNKDLLYKAIKYLDDTQTKASQR